MDFYPQASKEEGPGFVGIKFCQWSRSVPIFNFTDGNTLTYTITMIEYDSDYDYEFD